MRNFGLWCSCFIAGALPTGSVWAVYSFWNANGQSFEPPAPSMMTSSDLPLLTLVALGGGFTGAVAGGLVAVLVAWIFRVVRDYLRD